MNLGLVGTVVGGGLALFLYSLFERRINQRPCPKCGFRVSVDATEEICPRCGSMGMDKNAGVPESSST